jgi:outer membrane protein assembly factor BamA
MAVLFVLTAGQASADEEGIEEEKDFGLEILGGRAKLAAVPIPAYNESIGWSLGLAVAAYYRLSEADTVSPESMTALFGFYAENRTWGAGAYQKLHIDEDRWRVEFGGIYAEINFQTYASLPSWIGGGFFVDYTSEMTYLLAKGARLTWKRLYLGLDYRYMRSRTIFETGIPIDTELEPRTFSGLGIVATWDSRDNIFYPLKGYHVDFTTLWNRDWLGSDQDYDIYEYEASGYREYRKGHVLAARLHSRMATGDVPFEDQSVFFYIDLRGYTDGRYRADQRHTAQAEYRWNFWRRFFAVGFGGFGWSVDELSGITWDGILPSAGIGLRWRMISDPPVSIGVDYAWGKDDSAFYFRIGEAF